MKIINENFLLNKPDKHRKEIPQKGKANSKSRGKES